MLYILQCNNIGMESDDEDSAAISITGSAEIPISNHCS
jgi:hypothetical protein